MIHKESEHGLPIHGNVEGTGHREVPSDDEGVGPEGVVEPVEQGFARRGHMGRLLVSAFVQLDLVGNQLDPDIHVLDLNAEWGQEPDETGEAPLQEPAVASGGNT